MTQADYSLQVIERGKKIIETNIERGVLSMWNLHSFFIGGTPTDEEVNDAVDRLLLVSNFASTESVAGGPFHVLPSMLVYSKWKDRLPKASADRIKNFFLNGMIDRGNTENHWLMHYTGSLLAAEEWENEASMWNGMSPAAVHAEAKRWIIGMIERTVLTGHHEYDSTGYIAEHLTPLIGLIENTRDLELREKARKAATLLFTDMAVEYFHGAWAGSHSREGYRVNTWTKSGTVRGLFYLYFGGELYDPADHNQGFVIPNLAAEWMPPAMLAEIAFDRDKPFTVKKTKAPRTIFRHVEREASPVRKYTYMSRSFALGSAQVGLPGAPAGPIDLISWDLSWDGPKHQAKIGCNHPYTHPGRFSAFLSVLPQAAERDIATGKPYLQWNDRLFGASPYERILQHEGTALIFYRIPEDDRNPYINLYLPKASKWFEENGWLFADTGNFYIGLRVEGSYSWEEIREATASNIMVREGDLIDGWLLKIEDLHGGIALEAVEADDAGSFEEYRAERSAKDLDLSRWKSDGIV
ncbi:MAG: hypothetical protein HN368_00545, partial [Spirochaetales bacterium]|nr:hypothetical protein [Spirochaetales bacterium]